MNDVRQALLGAGKRMPAGLRQEIIAAGRHSVPVLLEIVADRKLWREDAPGEGLAPIHAAELLGELRAPEAVEPLLAAFLETEWMEALKDRALQALQEIGAPGLEPLLSALASAEDDDRRDDLCAVLSGLGVSDERILPALLAQLARNPSSGASNLASYGDPLALPALLEALDRHQVKISGLLTDQTLIELGAAVRELGGELRPAYVAKLEEMEELRQLAVREYQSEESPEPSATRRERPGRNQPCWCGSGKKYKKCHLDDDEAAERADPEPVGCCDDDPDPEEWLELDDGERIELCLREHQPLPPWHPKPDNLRLHSLVHAVVENQLALGDPGQVRVALTRLTGQGLSRHEAAHAIGSVVAAQLAAIRGGTSGAFDRTRHQRDLDGLSADSWRARR